MDGPVVIIFHRLGPYHWARLNALGLRCDLWLIEEAAETREYDWDRIDEKGQFHRVTLFRSGEGPEVERREMCERIRDALERIQPVAVAIPGWSDRAALAALLWCSRQRKRQVPAILMSESTAQDFPRKRWREQIKSRVVLTCSAALVGGVPQQEYLVQLGMPRDRIRFGYASVDNDHFRTKADEARRDAIQRRAEFQLPERYFLTCCRLIEKKNLSRLLDAFAQYRRGSDRNHWDLVIVGDGPVKESLQRQAAGEGIEKHVHWAGSQQYEKLPVYYGLANAFILPSTTEQWGLVVNEAMAAGLPVLVSNRCGCATDLVAEGQNGYSFDPFDPPRLSDLMTRLASEGDGRMRMGQKSRSIIAGHSLDRFADGLLDGVRLGLHAGPVGPSTLRDRLLLQALAAR